MCFRPPDARKPIKCPRCGALNPGGATKCRKCGLTEEEVPEFLKSQEEAKGKGGEGDGKS